MSDLEGVLDAFQAATQCEASVWTQPISGDTPPTPSRDAATAHAPVLSVFPTVAEGEQTLATADGDLLVAAVPGPRRAWLVLGPCHVPGVQLHSFMSFLLPVVTQYLQSALEVEHAANELAERYEEINLLYTISEILGRTVSLDEATKTILIEVSETVGARRATVLVHDHESNTLRAVAARGVDLTSV